MVLVVGRHVNHIDCLAKFVAETTELIRAINAIDACATGKVMEEELESLLEAFNTV